MKTEKDYYWFQKYGYLTNELIKKHEYMEETPEKTPYGKIKDEIAQLEHEAQQLEGEANAATARAKAKRRYIKILNQTLNELSGESSVETAEKIEKAE